MTLSTGGPTPARSERPASFEVHLDELRRFAQQLAAQADALTAQRDDLVALAPAVDLPDLLGQFAEAQSLTIVHSAGLNRLQDLHRQVEGMIRFADSVVTDVADHYEHHDGLAGDAFRSLTVGSSDPLGGQVRGL